MSIKKYLPTVTQAVQVIIIMVIAGMLGVVAKVRGVIHH